MSGTSVVGLLGLAFVVLKLTGHIDWNWFLVLLPYIFGVGVALITGVSKELERQKKFR